MHTNCEIMSLNLSSIFFYGMCIFSIYVNGTPLADNFKQNHPLNAANLPSTYQISEILYKVTTLDDFSKTEEKNETESLCKSLLGTLTTSQGTDTIRLAVAKVQHLISNHNQDTQQTIISNIFTILDSCVKNQVSEYDFRSFRENLSDTIENNESDFPKQFGKIEKMPFDSNPGGNADVSLNFDDNVSIDSHQGVSEEKRFGLEHENVPRDLDDMFTDVPVYKGHSDERLKKKYRNEPSGKEDRAHVYSGGNTNLIGSVSSRNSGMPRGLRRKYFLFDTGVPKPAIDEGLSRKIFLFDKGLHEDPDKTNLSVTHKNGKKTHFLFDDDLPELSSDKKSGFGKTLDFDY